MRTSSAIFFAIATNYYSFPPEKKRIPGSAIVVYSNPDRETRILLVLALKGIKSRTGRDTNVVYADNEGVV